MKLFATSQVRSTRRRSRRWALAVVSLIALCSLALAQEQIIRVARISLIEGDVSYQRANDQRDAWFDVTINMPLNESDQVYTGANGRTEVQLTGRNIVRLDRDTNLKITQFTTGTTQLALSVGTAIFRIDSLDRRQFQVVDARDSRSDDPVYFEVDTPKVAVTLLKEGLYRINVREDGTTEVIVRRGAAEVYNQEIGSIAIKQGRRVVVEGNDPNYYQIARLEEKDNWDRWNDRRDEELSARNEVLSSRYVPVGVPGLYELDRYGEWYSTPDYGYVWSPSAMPIGWAPYRTGYWGWYPAYGWTWISYEPWGWAPYHYGRWAYYRSRWCWVPHGGFSGGFSWSWSPALVTFYGFGGGNYRRGYRDGFADGYRTGYRNGAYDWVGWVPLAPGEHYYGHTTVINNTTVNNRIVEPRTIESLRNYSAPGGVTGLEGRQFTSSRVVVNNPTPLPRNVDPGRQLGPVPVRGDAFKPAQTESPRTNRVVSESASRLISAPVVTRRAPSVAVPSGATRAVEGGVPTLRGTGPVPGGEVNRAPRRDLPTREGSREVSPGRATARERSTTTDSTTSPAGRVVSPGSGETERSTERRYEPSRRPDYRPAERPIAPRRDTSGERGSGGNVERHESPRVYTPPRQESRPPSEGRSVEPPPRHIESAPRHVEPTPRRVEPSSPPPAEHRAPPTHTAPPPREERRVEPPPARSNDNATPRGERPSERPSSPPSRGSGRVQ